MIAYLLLLTLASSSVLLAGYDKQNSRDFHSAITSCNVDQLVVKWISTTCNNKSATATPLVLRDRVCVTDNGQCYSCWNRDSGALVLRKHMTADYGLPVAHYSRTTPTYVKVGTEELIILASNANASILNPTSGAWIFAVSFTSGELVWKSVVSSNNWTLVTQSPAIEKNFIYVGTSSSETSAPYVSPNAPCCRNVGTLYKYRAGDGSKVWSTPMIPAYLQGYSKYSGASIWGSSPIVVGNRVYVGTGQLYKVPSNVSSCILANPLNTSCIDSRVHHNSVVGLNKYTGEIEVSFKASGADIWNIACVFGGSIPGCQCLGVCDYDYDITGLSYSKKKQIFFATSKSGFVFALSLNLNLLWIDQFVNGSASGGIVWSNALRDHNKLDKLSLYVQQANDRRYNYSLANGSISNSGVFIRYNGLGEVVWATPTPNGDKAYGPVALTNDVLFGSTRTNGLLVAMHARTGSVLWTYQTNGSMSSGCAIAGRDIYWPLGPGTVIPGTGIVDQNKIVAFTLDE
ncbi:PQQ-binding beta-propeller repeat protein [uncultured virus]|nr:PQQ-binding beta-propeller repeat protein [uncultured virus]